MAELMFVCLVTSAYYRALHHALMLSLTICIIYIVAVRLLPLTAKVLPSLPQTSVPLSSFGFPTEILSHLNFSYVSQLYILSTVSQFLM
jgi:hypothetical protein